MMHKPVFTRKGDVAFHICRHCKPPRGFEYGDSLARHIEQKHGDAYQLEQEKLRRQDAQRVRRAARHKDLCAEVVKEALALWREASFMLTPLSRSRSAKPFVRACAKLDAFEGGR